MNNCVECNFKKGWRGHGEGVTVKLTPSRALELQKQKIVSITSTGQTVLSDLGYVVPKQAPPKQTPRKTAKRAAAKVEDKPVADEPSETSAVEVKETNEPKLESNDK